MLYINIFVSFSVVVGLLFDYMLSSQLLFSSILSLFITGSGSALSVAPPPPLYDFLISASGSDWLYNYFSKVKQLITNFYERITYKGWRSPAIQLKKSLVPATVI